MMSSSSKEEAEKVAAKENIDKGGRGNIPPLSNNDFGQNETKESEVLGNSASSSVSPPPSSSQKVNKGKSCKGCLYYSSALRSNSRNPLCVGLTRSLPTIPQYVVEESEVEASKEGRSLTDFKYGCVGYSVYSDQKDRSANVQETQTELPVCVYGIKVLMDRRVTTVDSTSAQIHNKEDGNRIPQPPRATKPAHSVGDEFLSRFTRSAGLVANGVAKNLRKAGNRIKESVDDILYPYRKRPK